MSLYVQFKRNARLCEQTAFVNIYRLVSEGVEYKIALTKRVANGHTVIHCEGNRIAWEQVPRFPQLAGRRYGDKMPIYAVIPEKDRVTVFVVRGKPDGFVGLDNGVFRCIDHFDDRCINVMSYRRFIHW